MLAVLGVLLLGMTLSSLTLFAQSGAGSIKGTVTDATGAVIPGAKIHVVNQGTNVVFDTQSNSVGFYQVPALFTGTYVLTVTAPGMKTSEQTIELQVSQDAVINAAMTTGAVTQQIEISASTVQLTTTDNGAITSTLENARINELPMNGRDMATLVGQTSPGFEACPESNGQAACANGLEGPATQFEVDGATLANREYGGVHQGSQQLVDPDAIQEVSVQDEGAGAQYAAPATAVLSTKSGTNTLHGSAFWTVRNNAAGVASNRSTPTGQAAAEYIRNEAGASVGGPIRIPFLYNGKDKTFFFFAYERYSLVQAPFEQQHTPSLAERNGDFSDLVTSSNVQQTLYDPYTTTGSGASTTRKTYASENNMGANNPNCASETNCIPLSQENALYKTFMAMTPLPTNSLNPLAGDNLTTQYYQRSVIPQETLRLDQTFNEDNRAYLRYTHNTSSPLTDRNDPAQAYTLAAKAPGGAAIPKWISGAEYQVGNVNAAALGFTHIFSPTFYSESVYSMTWYGENTWGGPASNTDFESALGLPNNFGETGFPYVVGESSSATSSAGLFQPFDSTMFNYSVTTTTYIGDENLTKILGKHQLLFGGRYMFEHMGSLPDRSRDQLAFYGYGTGLLNPSSYSSSAAGVTSNTGNANADEFLGAAYNYSSILQTPYQHLHDMELDGYIQDNWHARNNLTVNLGLRYEAHPAVWEGQGAMEGFDKNYSNTANGSHGAIVTSGSLQQLESEGLTTPAIITNMENNGAVFETPSQAGLPSMLVRSYNLNFAPRVGVAWQPFGKWGTVVRGAFGRYIYPSPVRESYREEGQNDPFGIGYSQNYTSSTYTPHSGYQLLSGPNSSSSFNYNTTCATCGTGGAAVGGGWPLMGVNSANVVNSAATNAITIGPGITNIDPNFAPAFVNEANFTIEQPVKWGSMLRVSYIYTHGTNLPNVFYYNNHPSTYAWEIQQGAVTPASAAFGPTNSSTGEGPYDNLVWGGNHQIQKTGWSNYNALQANYQKLYHNGSAWQVMYVWSKNLRTGGDYGGSAGDYVVPYSNYVNSYVGSYTGAAGNSAVTASAVADPGTWAGGQLSGPPSSLRLPPPPPAGVQPWQYYKALNRWENYMVDTNSPPHHLQFNGLYALPVGRGKHWLGNVNRLTNELVGGWQIAGDGSVQITTFAITTTNFGPTNPLQVYKKNAPITDCRSGNCLKGYEWFNGYIAPTAVSGNVCAAGLPSVSGLPGNWAPYSQPMDNLCGAPSGGKAVVGKYSGDNDVFMNNVTGQSANTEIGYGLDPGNNDFGSSGGTIDASSPYAHTILHGPWEWNADASLFKVFPITERYNVRLNADAFNVFNHQGLAVPSGSDGTTCYTPGGLGCSSYNTARQIQLTLRLTF
jgi:hypothetical protein